MWIRPTPTAVHTLVPSAKDIFCVLKSNDYCAILLNRKTRPIEASGDLAGSYRVAKEATLSDAAAVISNIQSSNLYSYAYWIILRDVKRHCVAVSESEAAINIQWEYIEHEIMDGINKYHKNDSKAEIFEFLVLKFLGYVLGNVLCSLLWTNGCFLVSRLARVQEFEDSRKRTEIFNKKFNLTDEIFISSKFQMAIHLSFLCPKKLVSHTMEGFVFN